MIDNDEIQTYQVHPCPQKSTQSNVLGSVIKSSRIHDLVDRDQSTPSSYHKSHSIQKKAKSRKDHLKCTCLCDNTFTTDGAKVQKKPVVSTFRVAVKQLNVC